ncbi:MAG: dihydrofolate reductase family protein [Anaerolineae bacterium]|nr:dihydrofolate reductase family protein [Anaerolineae bacterium]
MRKLKLQMFMSLDGYVGALDEGSEHEHESDDETTSELPDELEQYLHSTIDTSDTILLGRKSIDGFVTEWERIASNLPEHPEFQLAKKLVATPKVVFSKTLKTSSWSNTTLATGDLVDEVNKLKNKAGKDIIVYGGAGFVASLISEDLIDEYHLFINPNALGQGLPIFNQLSKPLNLKLKAATTYSNGVVGLLYEPSRD